MAPVLSEGMANGKEIPIETKYPPGFSFVELDNTPQFGELH